MCALSIEAGRMRSAVSREQTSSDPIITVDGLTKRYGQLVAVDGISFAVYPGETFGMLGPNGAGKTTTLEMIEGLRQPDSGRITFMGLDAVRDRKKVQQRIGVQLQSQALWSELTVEDRKEHGLGLALFRDGPPSRHEELRRLKAVYDPANVFCPHLLLPDTQGRFIGSSFRI